MAGDETRLSPRTGVSDRGRQALVVTTVLTGLAAIVVAMRLYARLGLLKIMGREDWTILVALFFSLIYLGLVIGQVMYGMGIHQDRLPEHEITMQLKCLWGAIPQYNASLGCSKFSILFQYLRIFPSRKFRYACYIVMAIVAAYTTWAVVSGYVNCVPVPRFWNRKIDGYCLSFEAVWFFNASMNIATDIALLVLPMPLLSALQLPRMQKFALMGVFAVGIFIIVTSALRLEALHHLAQHMNDISYHNVGAAYWTAAECNVAIICACLPLLRPIVSRIFPKLMATSSYRRNTSKNYYGGSRSQRLPTYMFSRDQERDYDMYEINVKPGEQSGRESDRGIEGGIEVTTEMIQETTKNGESTSERRLVLDPS
ncbi:integral membrane protein [Aspergillus sp. HF37]|nr:integral membrane protein [Aspergillus sp. HF37]